MDNQVSGWLDSVLNLDLPRQESLDAYVDSILPKIRYMGEDLYETHFYLNKRWVEVRDDDKFMDAILHIFHKNGEYLKSTNGNIQKGKWKYLNESNTMILEMSSQSELFDLAFMNDDFFILQKHGDQVNRGKRKYFFLARERRVGGLEWNDIVQILFNIYRSNMRYVVFMGALVIFVVLILILSFM